MTEKHTSQWSPSDKDIFLLLLSDNTAYYYALESALARKGDHYYKRQDYHTEKYDPNAYEEVQPSEIVQIVKNREVNNNVEFKCPCLQIVGDSIMPFFRDSSKSKTRKL